MAVLLGRHSAHGWRCVWRLRAVPCAAWLAPASASGASLALWLRPCAHPQFDLKNKRVFLRRCPFPSVQLSDLFLGAKITVYVVLACGEAPTREAFGGVSLTT